MRYFFLAFLLLNLSSYSQTISKQVIGPGGQTFENGNNSLSHTVGEVAVGAMTDEDGTYQLGNGYYPSLNLSTLNTETPELKLQVKVFPNPTRCKWKTNPTNSTSKTAAFKRSNINQRHLLYNSHHKRFKTNQHL
jgi:hypothetical protein